jgi:3-hydroxyacyl-CoA dehydrogenase
MSKPKNIAVIGAGLMGHGIAQIFAVHGHPVNLMDLEDTVLSNAIQSIRSNLALMARKGIGSEAEIEPAIQRIRTTTDLAEAVSQAQFVVEAVLEKLDLKQNIFKELDALCPPDTILATNTSVISITEIAQKSNHRGRIVGTHFWNPPYLIPLVEVWKTSGAGAQRYAGFCGQPAPTRTVAGSHFDCGARNRRCGNRGRVYPLWLRPETAGPGSSGKCGHGGNGPGPGHP